MVQYLKKRIRTNCGTSINVLIRSRKPLFALILFCIYFIYVNYFGVVAFFSINMFIEPLFIIILFVWGMVVALSLRCETTNQDKALKLITGLMTAFIPYILFSYGSYITDAGINRKVYKYNEQLTEMCKRIINENPERFFISLNDYDEFNIWAFGARPTRNYGYHEDGIVYLDFNGSPDNGSGIIYNPKEKPIRFNKNNYYHMFGPWYRFKVDYD